MGFSCPICSEKLEKSPGETQARQGASNEVNISAPPCGHIFHTYCIQRWLTGNGAANKQCPCCRKEVPKLRCLALFPNTYDDGDYSFSQDVPAPCNHGELITSLKGKVTRLEGEIREKDQLYQLLSTDFETLRERLRNEKLNSDMWMLKAKQFESYQDLARETEAKLNSALNQLKCYNQIEGMLRGVEEPVAEELPTFPPTIDSIRTLLEMKHIMTVERRNASKKIEELKSSCETLRSEKMKLKQQYDKKSKELKELHHVFETSKVNGRIRQRSTSPVAGPSTTPSSATPKPFKFSKRRLQQPITPSAAVKDSPGLDADVEIIPVGFQSIRPPKKKAPTSTLSRVQSQDEAATSKSKKGQKLKSSSQQLSAPDKVSQDSGTGNSTIVLSSDESSQDMHVDFSADDDDEFKIRGSVPGAPVPMSSKQLKALEARASSTLGSSMSSGPKKFKFKSKACK